MGSGLFGPGIAGWERADPVVLVVVQLLTDESLLVLRLGIGRGGSVPKSILNEYLKVRNKN